MESSDKSSFAVAIDRLAEMYGLPALSRDRVDGYFEALKDLSLPTLLRAMEDVVRNVKRFPVVADLRDAVYRRQERGEGRGSYPADVAAQRRRYGLPVN